MDKGLVGGMMGIDFLGAADHTPNFPQAKRKRERIDSTAIPREMDFFSIPPGRPAFPGAVKKELELADDGGGGAPKLGKCDVNTGLKLNLLIANTGSDQSTVDDGSSDDKESKTHELAALQLELNRVSEENRRLKEMLAQVSSNYNALQMQLFNFMQQQQQQHRSKGSGILEMKSQPTPISERLDHDKVVPRQFMDPGRAMDMEHEHSESSSEGRTESASPRKEGFSRQQGNVNATASNEIISHDNITAADGGDGRRSSAREDSSDQGSHGWAPSKAVPAKNDDQSNEATLRKARVSVRARSEASMISDGCQWRKYGQKMAKGNPCPRAYYRCTMATGCPVRKQVQRCAEDRSILITTYEGSHNHPLPPAAVAMASTTSAAASMLLSGSMSSADGGLMNNFLARTVLPCSSNMATISASAPFPTVTLDLTNTPSPLQFQRPPTQFPVPFAGVPQGFAAPATATMPQIFGQSLYNQSKFSGLHVSPNVDVVVPNQFAVPHPPPTQGPPSSLADTVSAATAAITADPNFTAALAAAITSIIGGGGAPVQSAILNDNKQ